MQRSKERLTGTPTTKKEGSKPRSHCRNEKGMRSGSVDQRDPCPNCKIQTPHTRQKTLCDTERDTEKRKGKAAHHHSPTPMENQGRPARWHETGTSYHGEGSQKQHPGNKNTSSGRNCSQPEKGLPSHGDERRETVSRHEHDLSATERLSVKQAEPFTQHYRTAGRDHCPGCSMVPGVMLIKLLVCPWNVREESSLVKASEVQATQPVEKKQRNCQAALTPRAGSCEARRCSPHACAVTTVTERGSQASPLLPGCPAGHEMQPGRSEPNKQPPREGLGTGTCRPGECSPKKEHNMTGAPQTAQGSYTGPPDLQRRAHQAAPKSTTAALPQKAQQTGGSAPGTTVTQAQQGRHLHVHTQ
ncbi:hypothetical protein NDU88_001844 [Pleurodeles waltl]|uniref:Uncharacterized protein n=1 Tax=Pleurodeles waltl TaxID=8319 RepID=A0AAV7NEK5_PLEWA|nr:hypothetical protein NDU88_001844 [Pleurodeles waltl]